MKTYLLQKSLLYRQKQRPLCALDISCSRDAPGAVTRIRTKCYLPTYC